MTIFIQLCSGGPRQYSTKNEIVVIRIEKEEMNLSLFMYNMVV